MNYIPTIGLEIHVEMKTKSKMFSSAPVEFGAEPNTLVVPNDMGFPGTMPVPNKQAVINAIRVCNALHMEIDNELWFDRKNYFYSDLPKGYQITQDKRPIGKNGYLDIEVNGVTERVEIERLHMEEDTCKQIHFPKFTLVDYNRAGTPLIEIVTKPCIHSPEVAAKYVETIREIVVFADVSDGKMEEGSLRCDVNISLMESSKTGFGTKVEVKNINSFAHIENALKYEIKRQSELLDKGEAIVQETRRYNEETLGTVSMRLKSDSVDYKYFTEPNIIPIRLSDDFIKDAIKSCPELASEKKKRYIETYGLSNYDTDVLLSNIELTKYFDKCSIYTKHYKPLANWLIVDVTSYINKNGIDVLKFPIAPNRLAGLINLIESGDISNKIGRDLFAYMLRSDASAEEAKKALGIVSQVSDDGEIRKVVNQVLDNNKQSIEDYKAGKGRAIGFLIGQVMKLTGGKVNPSLTNKIMIEEINKRS